MLVLVFSIYFFVISIKSKNKIDDLLLQRNNYETISKKANDIILSIDIVTGSIYSANNQASEMLGYSISELCKKTIHDLHPNDLIDLSAQTIAKVWDKKGLVYQDLPFITAKKEILDVECSAKVLVYNDKPVIVIYARDIRKRLKLEKDIRERNQLIADKNKSITDSINYARRIQQAILGDHEKIKSLFKDSFVLLKPHSIVSGDFYWFYQAENYKVIAAADCTGHGVPGAFMTVLGHDFLEEIIGDQKIIMPDEILYQLNKKVVARLSVEDSKDQITDGMDIAILSFDERNSKVYYSGAKNPLCIIHNNELEIIKPSKNPIGGRRKEKKFELHEINIKPDTTFYIYSDGFQDQFGGDNDRKFLSTNFRSLLKKISVYDMSEQEKILGDLLKTWRGDHPQTDDVLVIGIKV